MASFDSVFCAWSSSYGLVLTRMYSSCFIEEGPHAIGICGKGLRRKYMGSKFQTHHHIL